MQSEGRVPSVGEPPARSIVSVVVPALVMIGTLGVVGASAWPTLRPAREVRVVQAALAPEPVDGRDPPGDASVPAGDAGGSGKVVQAAGWLEGEPFYVACAALTDGVIESIDALEGDAVRQGQIVATLVDEDNALRLARREGEVALAESRLESARAELRAAEIDWGEPVELYRAVETARAMRDEATGERAQLPALIDAAQADLTRLEEERSRVEQLVGGGGATDLEGIIALQRVLAQRASIVALEARGAILDARIARVEADLAAAERHLALRTRDRRRLEIARAGVGEGEAVLASARAARDEAALALERTRVRSPIDGVVQARLKVPGDKVVLMMDDPHSAHVLHLYDPSRLQVRVDVPLADAAHVSVGQACEVVVEVLPERTFAGRVLRIAHEADVQKNTLQVKVGVVDPDPALRPEMLTRVRFLAGGAGDRSPASERSTGILIPGDAIDESAIGSVVWAIRDRRGRRGVARPIPVEIVARRSGWVEARGDLRPGEILAVGASGLRDGQSVRVAGLSGTGGDS